MNTTQLECFMEVANFLNFSRAAEHLRITQPAVSHQITALEDELGVKLFQRTSKSVRLTKEGYLFTQYAGEILKEMHGAFVKTYGTDYLDNGSYEFVSIPAVIRSRCTGKLCLGIVTLDLSSSGEHWGTDFLTPYGVVSQGTPDMNADLQKYLRDNFIPYDYWYTADVERDIHISLDGMPEDVADLIAAARGGQQNQEFDYTMKL